LTNPECRPNQTKIHLADSSCEKLRTFNFWVETPQSEREKPASGW